jgi:hypothetical protein
MRFGGKFVLGFVLLSGALWTVPALAQSCAMCRANAKATPKEAQRAINRAILVMVMPPIGAVTLGTSLIVRYARRRDEENERMSSEAEIDARIR